MFGGVATGVVNAQDAAIPIAMTTGYGETPTVSAIEIAIGASRAAAAVFDMNCVRPQESTNIAKMMTYGEGASPMRLTTKFAMSAPAPVLSIALARGSIPAKRKIVVQSMP